MEKLENNKPKKLKFISIFSKGIIKENPVFVLLLGTCPTLAVTTSAINGIGMGVATLLVLFFSNIFISLIRNLIPSRVRIPSFIVIIAGFVTVVGFLVQAYAPDNGIMLGRAWRFVVKNKVLESALDGLGMGVGFTFALFLIGAARELLGSGMIFGYIVTSNLIDPMGIFLMPPGGFFIFGIMIAAVNKIMTLKNRPPKMDMGC